MVKVGMPSDNSEHNEKPNHVRNRYMPAVTEPKADRFCLRILV